MKHNLLLKIFLVSLFVRLIFLAVMPPRPVHWDDTLSWDAVANNLANGRGFLEADGTPTSIRAPVYPIILAFLYLLFGHNFLSIKIFQAVAGSATVVVLYLISRGILGAKKTDGSHTAGHDGTMLPALGMDIPVITALLLAVYPPLVVYTHIIGTETLYIFLMSVWVYCILTGLKYRDRFILLCGGFVLGVSNLCRSTAIFYPFFLAAAIFLVMPAKETFRKRTVELVLFILISLLPVLPWTLRNYRTFDRFLLVNTSAGELFWAGTYLPWDGLAITDRDPYFWERFGKIKNPVDGEKEMFREGIRNIRENPSGFMKLTVKKFVRFWFQPVGQSLVAERSKKIGIAMYLFHFVWLAMACFGFIKSKQYRLDYLPVTVLFVYFTVMHNVITSVARYRLPIEPYIMFFAVYGLMGIKDKILK
ncbi:MAG: glycosyltransferase family 39 protein [Elusimicrobia bacterium]|nr:glycosyltransferase family 39 protein [Elusimicrobiota bacterium]